MVEEQKASMLNSEDESLLAGDEGSSQGSDDSLDSNQCNMLKELTNKLKKGSKVSKSPVTSKPRNVKRKRDIKLAHKLSKVVVTRSDRKEESKGCENDVTCMICLEQVVGKTKMNRCSHYFCFECIKKWVEVTNCCPLCKVPSLSLHKFGSPVNGSKNRLIERIRIRAKQQTYFEELEDIPQFAEVCYMCGDDG